MGPQFAQTCTKFTETIRALGPMYKNKKLPGAQAA